jgi:hypothetical protein
MEIQSKTSWKLFILLTLLVIANTGFIFLFLKIINDSEKVPFGVLVIPTAFVAILFPLFIMIVRSLKTLTVVNKQIEVNFLFGKTYKLTSLEGYNEVVNYDKFGKYKTFYFNANSKTFKFGNREFKNYDELAENIINKTIPTEINIYFEIKILIIAFLVSLGILLLTIEIGNQ